MRAVGYLTNASQSGPWSSDSDPGGHCSHHHWRSGFRTMRLVHLRSMVQLVLVYLHNCGRLSQSVSIHFIISKLLYPLIITSIFHLFVHPCPLPNPRLTRSSSYRRSAYTSYVLSVTAHGVSHVSCLSIAHLIGRLFHILFFVVKDGTLTVPEPFV